MNLRGRPALLAVAHGSPQPRAEPVLEALMAQVRVSRPGLRADLAYLGHTDPDVGAAIGRLVADGERHVVVVPLLLGTAYHARVDLPALLDAARAAHPGVRIDLTPVLGPAPALFALMRRRIGEAHVPADTALVLGAIGAGDAAANASTSAVAAELGARVGFATCEPTVAAAVAEARAEGAQHVTVVSYVLAPGQLPDRFHAAGADAVTAVLGASPEVADVVLRRYDEAVPGLATRGGSVITGSRVAG